MNWLKQNWFRVSLLVITIITGFSIGSAIVLAHPGSTDSSGCHTCRTNCPNWGLSYGEYHCHNAKALPQPKAPIKSTFGEGGTGSTRPAPEYSIPSVSIPKNVEKPLSASVTETVKPETKRGLLQWIFGLFR
ncbi:MAG: YHYH domain-containing protein [Candidatus Jorgensenbacteria bacterium]|nr:YHYH domain-containing protein [Candidatus Jorgensenbacteria bacterium]